MAIAIVSAASSACSSESRRTYAVAVRITETRSGPGDPATGTSELTARLDEVRRADGSLRIQVDDVTKDGQPLPTGLLRTYVTLDAAGKLVVSPDRPNQRADETLLVLQLVTPMLRGIRPRSVTGPAWPTPHPVTETTGARHAQRVRGLGADQVSRVVQVEVAAPVSLYERRASTYVATTGTGAIVPAPSPIDRPTRTETYVVDPGPGIVDTIVLGFGCMLTLGFFCARPYDAPPQQRTRTVVVDGPPSIDVSLAGPIVVEVSTLAYGRGERTLLQATATGHLEVGGNLTDGDGVPPQLSGQPVKIAADWTASADLNGDWPRPSLPPPVLVVAVAVLVAVAAGVAAVARWSGRGRRW